MPRRRPDRSKLSSGSGSCGPTGGYSPAARGGRRENLATRRAGCRAGRTTQLPSAPMPCGCLASELIPYRWGTRTIWPRCFNGCHLQRRSALMPWVGRTKFSTIGVGTSIRLEEIPTVPGRSPSPVQTGSEIVIEVPGGVETKATVLSVADNEIKLKLPDGTVWQMTHHNPFDPPINVESPGLNQQDWVVRSAQPFRPSSSRPGQSSARSPVVAAAKQRRRRSSSA
jgi:hypothetical protein